jgi:hypothetical protein
VLCHSGAGAITIGRRRRGQPGATLIEIAAEDVLVVEHLSERISVASFARMTMASALFHLPQR